MDTLTTCWSQRLAHYIHESGPVKTACLVSRIIQGKRSARSAWQAVRGRIGLDPVGEPVYTESEPAAPVRRSRSLAQRDLERLVDTEKRIVAHVIPGRLNDAESELIMAMIADMTGRQDLWP